MTVNLNDTVRVKLSDLGVKVLHDHYARFNVITPVPRPDRIYSFQLWSLMNIFGSVCYLGNEVPFEGANIEVVEKV